MGNNVHYTVKGVEVRVESTALSSLGIVRMWTAQQALRIDVNLCKKPGSDSCQAGPLATTRLYFTLTFPTSNPISLFLIRFKLLLSLYPSAILV